MSEKNNKKLDSFYPYCFKKSDHLAGMDARHGTIFMGILMGEFKNGN